MSSRSMNLDVLVRLRDRLTGPLRRLRDQLKSLADFGRKIGMLGVAIAAISFMGPIKEAAAFQQKLLDIAGTAELSGKAAFKFVDDAREKFEALALATGQASDIIAAGAGQMIATGLDRGLIEASIGGIATAATAANAEFSDMAGVATSLMQTLNVPAGELRDSLAALVVSGKLGAFEMKDMAKYFPTLTSQVAKFGVKGREAVNFLGAALQIARKGTSDPAEAANNLKNFLSKILAPATIKNFKDAGIDIQAVMQDAATKGINPIEAVMQKIVKLTGVSGKEIAGMMKKAQANGLSGADALASVREQLEKIHGAGALGEIFADQQVMDFLIPFLANVDEFRRIKDEVAKATGGMIDADFETQMEGLNRQLAIFQEIGTQASREVGFAFGSWLPVINENLAAALKWYREWNKETGGLGTRILTMAGGGILLATALGALGIALPIVGAGFAALGALLSPVGIAIGLVAAGAYYLYKNWGTYGKRVMGYWDAAKRGFWSFVDGVRNRGQRLIEAGREIFNLFGPQIAAGLNAAWQDVKGGFEHLKTFFKSIADAANIKFDLSGLSIDNAKLVAIKALEVALNGVSAAWQALKDFGGGFAKYLPDIGESIGKQINNLMRIASAFGRLGAALASLVGLDSGKVSGFFRSLGELAGAEIAAAANLGERIGNALATIVEKLADLTEGKLKIDWSAMMPDKIVAAWNNFAAAINAVRSALEWFDKSTVSPTMPEVGSVMALDNANAVKSANSSLIKQSTTDTLPGKTKDDIGLGGDNRFSPARARQTIDVGGSVVIKVEGPGQVTSTSSANKNVPLTTSNTGRVVGRV
jgi:TP901 family phage tail tape measure protein